MGYELRAVIADPGLLVAATGEVSTARVVPLSQGLALVPMTDEFFDAITDGTLSDGDDLGFHFLPGGFARVLAAWSADGPVAYVEADYFGGIGEQRAAVWADGALAFGPVGDGPQPQPVPRSSPVSRALRLLGVQAERGRDEFATVGLQRHRHPDDWAAADGVGA